MVLIPGFAFGPIVALFVQQATTPDGKPGPAQPNPTQPNPTQPDPVQPDRPNFTNSAHVVPVGHAYLETGYRQTHLDRLITQDFGDSTTLRVGLKGNFEARIGIPSYVSTHGGGESATGFADQNLAFKWRFTPEVSARHPAFAVLGSAEAPSGARAFRAPQWQTSVTAIGSFTLDARTEVDADLLYSRPADDVGAYSQLSASSALSRDLGKGFGSFIEFFTNRPQVGREDAASYFDAGVTKLINYRIQVDAFIGRGANGISNDYFFGVGLSYGF
jgi:hypothetical protein